MRSKGYQAIKEQASAEAVDVVKAIDWLKEHGRPSFDETIEIHIKLGIDSKKSDQAIRGNVVLPSGSTKQQQIVVFTDDAKQQKEVKAAGVEVTGGEELIEKISAAKNLAADLTIATPMMMPKVAKIAKILGPKGLMPNPKMGTVTDDPVKTVGELQSGKISFKMDPQGNIHQAIGKTSWDTDKIIENYQAVKEAVESARPEGAKGKLLRTVTIKSTMSPGIRLRT